MPHTHPCLRKYNFLTIIENTHKNNTIFVCTTTRPKANEIFPSPSACKKIRKALISKVIMTIMTLFPRPLTLGLVGQDKRSVVCAYRSVCASSIALACLFPIACLTCHAANPLPVLRGTLATVRTLQVVRLFGSPLFRQALLDYCCAYFQYLHSTQHPLSSAEPQLRAIQRDAQ